MQHMPSTTLSQCSQHLDKQIQLISNKQLVTPSHVLQHCQPCDCLTALASYSRTWVLFFAMGIPHIEHLFHPAISGLLWDVYHILVCSCGNEHVLEMYVKDSCLNRELIGLKEMVEAVAATDEPTIRMVEFSEGKQPPKSYKRYEVPLKPGTDTEQLVEELCKNEAVQQVAIVRPRGGNGEGVDAPVCTIL